MHKWREKKAIVKSMMTLAMALLTYICPAEMYDGNVNGKHGILTSPVNC
jgi:hypothetical protein